MCVYLCSVRQLCWTVCDPMDCSPLDFSVHGIFQARILERVAISSSRGYSWPRDRTHVSCVSCNGRILYHCASYSHWIKKQRLLLSTKVYLVETMVFPVVMYGCESWTIKKVKCQRIDAFELWCWRKLLRVPWTARRSNQSVLKEISPEYPLEELMMKLKRQYFGHLMWRADSLEKTLMLGKIEGKRRGWQMTRWLNGITDSMDMSLSKLREMVKHRETSCAAVHGVTKSQTWLSDWTELKHYIELVPI